jgi:hypothetical protein
MCPELRERILAMAKRWDYYPDEIDEALRLAEQDPIGWERLVAADEELHQ